jgi:hypothetical protein
LNKRIAARKIGAAIKQKGERQKYIKNITNESKIDPQASQTSKQTLEDTAATTISSILRGHKGRARTERLKKIQDTIKEKTILSNIAQPKLTTNKRYYADAIEESSFKRQLIKDTTTEDTVRDVVNDMVKCVEKAHGLQILQVPKVKKGRLVLKRQYHDDVKFIFNKK